MHGAVRTTCCIIRCGDNAESQIDFSHEHARSRTFRWGEDGIAGVCDSHGLQNIAFVFWNEKEFVPPGNLIRVHHD